MLGTASDEEKEKTMVATVGWVQNSGQPRIV